MPKVRTFTKGQIIFNSGDPANRIYLIQSGMVSVFITKGEHKVEVYQVGTSHVLGEHALFGTRQYVHSAEALGDTKAVEISVEELSKLYEPAPQIMKIFMKSIAEKEKKISGELKEFRLSQDSTPCPVDKIAKIFGTIYHTARYTGTNQDGKMTVNWVAFKQYSQRIFDEPPTRLEQAVYVCVKTGLAELEMSKEEAEDGKEPAEVLEKVHFSNLPAIEKFFEYYQHFYFRKKNPTLFRVDDKWVKFLNVLLAVTKNDRMDRNGVVNANLVQTLEKTNEAMGTQSTDYFGLLESKGLFANKRPNSSGGLLQFHREEFESMAVNWKILREIELWNAEGKVTLKDPGKEEKAVVLSNCPSCGIDLNENQKFCANCGENLQKLRQAA